MRCDFQPLGEFDSRGWQRWKCRRCQRETAPTPHDATQIHAACRALGEPVGDELKALLASWNITATEDCQCEARAQQMNAWGMAGCREHRGVIVGWLIEEARNRGWTAEIAAKAGSGWLVDEAIRRAEAKITT